MPLRLGTMNFVQERPGVATADVLAQCLDEAQAAEDLGYGVVWYAEHHFSTYCLLPSPNVFLGAVATRTRRVRLGTMVNVLPFHSPVRLAEEAALLDQLSGGRLEFGVGRGVQQQEFDAFNLPMAESREMFEEALEVVLGAWQEQGYSHHGQYYHFDNVRIEPRLVQQPHPPLVFTATSPPSLEWAGRRGLRIATILAPLEALAHGRALYREHRRAAGHPDVRDDYLPFRHVYIADSDAAARAVAEPALHRYFELFGHVAYPAPGRTLPRGYEFYEGRFAMLAAQTYDSMDAKAQFLIGSPETVARRLQEHLDTLDTDCFMGIFSFGTLTHAQVVESMRRFVEEVVPRVVAPSDRHGTSGGQLAPSVEPAPARTTDG